MDMTINLKTIKNSNGYYKKLDDGLHTSTIGIGKGVNHVEKHI
jgi:hypothetical protein